MTLIHGLSLLVAAAAVGERILVYRTVRRLRRQLAAASYHATHDRLSGLLNRGGLEDAFNAGTNTWRWLLIIDLDAFKAVNDRYGHPTGDLVLAALGTRIQRLANGTAGSGGRLGGDEFAVILPQADFHEAARAAAALAAPITVAGLGTGEVTVSASVGITAVAAGLGWKTALAHADIALYHAKRRHHPVTFEPTMTYPRPPWPRRQIRELHPRAHDARHELRRGNTILPPPHPDNGRARPTETGEQP